MLTKFNDGKIIYFLLLIAAVLRISFLGYHSLWYDELWSVEIAKNGFLQDIEYPPAYQVLLSVWSWIFGYSEFMVRMPSVLFGLATILIFYKTVMLENKEFKAIVLTTLFILLPIHIAISQEARGYSLLLFFAVTAIYFFSKMIISKEKSDFSLYLFFSLIMIYVHFFGFLLFLGTLCYFVFFVKEKPQKWIIRSIIFGFASLPATFLLLKAYFQVKEGFWIEKPNLKEFLYILKLFTGGYFQYLLTLFLVVLIPIYKLFTKTLFIKINLHYFLVFWLFSISMIISFIFNSIFHWKYFLILIPSVLWILFDIGSMVSKKFAYFYISILIILTIPGTLEFYHQPSKEGWREMQSFLNDRCKKEHEILIYNEFEFDDFEMAFQYYNRSPQKAVSVNNKKSYNDLKKNNASVLWFIETHVNDKSNVESIHKEIRKTYPKVFNYNFEGIVLYEYTR